MRHIKQIVVHCTASPDHKDFSAKDIRQWHLDRGWSDIGYHYVVKRNGEIETGRPERIPGAHARGVNSTSIGIVWVGTNNIDPRQEKSLLSLIQFLMGKFNVDIDGVVGHNEAVKTNKTCPNLDMARLRAELIFVQPQPKVR